MIFYAAVLFVLIIQTYPISFHFATLDK